MTTASVVNTIAVNPGTRISVRIASFISCMNVPVPNPAQLALR
jgi:hypothetical protein